MKTFLPAKSRATQSSLRPMLCRLLALLAVVFATDPAAAQATVQDKASDIDEIFDWTTPTAPGCVVAVSLHGELIVERAYGSADLERNVPLSPSSVFDIGSTQKQFVAAAVLLLDEAGQISLSEDIRKYIPELPDTGHKITVDHLLTHTSGIRDWTGIAMLSGGDEDALTMILRQRGLNFAPGEEWSYSNSGYVLLTEMIARTCGMSFAEFAQVRLFEPLGMKSTRYLEDLRAIVENRALAYEKEGDGWRLDMLLDNDRGGGGALFSTAGDLIIWNEALASGRLGAFVTEKLHEPATLNNGRELGYARGLALDTNRGGRVVWHGGSAAGYKSLVGRYPEQGLCIAILCNGGDGAEGMMSARRIYDLFVPVTVAPDAAANAPAANADLADAEEIDVSSKAGLFFNELTGEPLRLIVRGGRLLVAGGPRLVPVAKDRFRNPSGTLSFMSQDEFELHFLSSDEFELKSMEGETTRYRRAEPYAPTPADLEGLAGRYGSDEIGAVFQIAAEEGGLVVRLEHSPDKSLQFRLINRDTFQGGRMTVRFRRDEAGNVVAFAYSNPMLRDIRFTRLSEEDTSRR